MMGADLNALVNCDIVNNVSAAGPEALSGRAENRLDQARPLGVGLPDGGERTVEGRRSLPTSPTAARIQRD